MTYSAILHRYDSDPLHFGDDEAAVGDILTAPEWGTVAPGGFDDGQLVLTRPDQLTSLDKQQLASLEIYRDGEPVYEGRVAALTPTDDALAVQCQGWASHLLDDETFSQVYRDASVERWGSVTDARRIAMGTLIHPGEVTTADNPITPAILTTLTGQWDEATGSAEAQYDAGPGQTISSIEYTMAGNGNVATAHVGLVGVGDDDVLTNATYTSDLVTASPPAASGTYTPTTPRRWGYLIYQTVVAPTDKKTRWLVWYVAVNGDHGLTNAGGGYYASDIVQHMVSGAPLLSVETGAIDSSAFIVPHYVVTTTTRWEAIDQASLFAGQYPEWGVYHGRKFFWRKPGAVGRTWRVRKDQGARIEWAAADSSVSCNGVIVSYDAGDGVTRTIGPTGSDASSTTDALLDSSEDNPWTRAGINRWKAYDAGRTSADGATILGKLYLQSLTDIQRSGTVNLTGDVMDEGGNAVPVEFVRSYDYLIVEDENDDGGTDPLPVTQTRFSDETLVATVGRSDHVLDALRARLDSVTR